MLAIWGLDSLTEASCSTLKQTLISKQASELWRWNSLVSPSFSFHSFSSLKILGRYIEILYLTRKWATKVHSATPGLVGLQPQHAGAGELVVGWSARAFLLNLNYMDRVPAALDLLRVPVTSLLDKNNSWKWWCWLYCWLNVHCSVHLQTHGPGPKGKQRRRLLRNTFLCTGRKQCWRQSPASSISRSASLHRPMLARTGCSKATCNYRI